MKCENCDNEAMSNNSRFCKTCADAYGLGWNDGLRASAQIKEIKK